MIKLLIVLTALALLGSGCSETEPTLTYQYEVEGKGDDVSVTYYVAESNELVEERVSLPWTSDEFDGTNDSPARLVVDGPEGSQVKCIVRHRPINAEYGDNGSGESSQHASDPDEDQTACALDQEGLLSGP